MNRSGKSHREWLVLPLTFFFLWGGLFFHALPARSETFSSWRPYNNPNRLISVGMNKGQVIAVAGKPEHEESYYQSSGRRLIRISDWYYFRPGDNPETTLLKFVEENLVSITSTPTQ